MQQKNQEFGFSLIEVVIVASLMSVLALGAATMINQQSLSVNFLQDKLSRVNMERELTDLLSDSSLCQSTFQGLRPSRAPASLNALNGDGGTSFLSQNSAKEGVVVNRISYRNIDLTPPATTGRFELQIDLSRERKGGGPQEMRPILRRVHANIDGSGTITSCNIDRSNLGAVAPVLPRLECRTVTRNYSPATRNKVARCPAGFQITGCTAGCRGNSLDTDMRINAASNSCFSDDSLCGGARPRIFVYANCCRITN